MHRPVVEEMLDDLELGYAISVHKAQGSQWPRVIVPVREHCLLDQTQLYTAHEGAEAVGDDREQRFRISAIGRCDSHLSAQKYLQGRKWSTRLPSQSSHAKLTSKRSSMHTDHSALQGAACPRQGNTPTCSI